MGKIMPCVLEDDKRNEQNALRECGEGLTNEGVRAVRSFLFKIGLYSNLMGFDFLVCAVGEVLNNPRCLHYITKQLYPSVARKFATTPTSVERNIRNAIEAAYNRGKLREIANTYYGANFSKYEKPTNGEFISFIANIARNA